VLVITRTVVLEAVTKAAVEGIRILDERLEVYVRTMKKEKRGE
jgi:hypothetical protein